MVANQGGDFPRIIDLETTKGRVKDPLETLRYFTVVSSLDFGTETATEEIEVRRNDFADGVLVGGSSLEVNKKIRVRDNQKSVAISAGIPGGAYCFKTGEHGADNPYEQDIDIPIWDSKVVRIQSQTRENLDGSVYATRGPVGGSVQVGPESEPSFSFGELNIPDPISPENTEFDNGRVLGKGIEDDDDARFKGSVYPFCPDGSRGDLSDGNSLDNLRFLDEGWKTDTAAVYLTSEP